jgi:predicted aldo/keto reductase-like oxidoreductase
MFNLFFCRTEVLAKVADNGTLPGVRRQGELWIFFGVGKRLFTQNTHPDTSAKMIQGFVGYPHKIKESPMMIYKDFQNLKLSALALGAMRLPFLDGDDRRIDESATAEMVAYAIEHGINYFDTAWGYHGGNSELVIGAILSKYPRNSHYFASKFPGYDLSNMDKVEYIFEKQLEKCRVDHFDFYMFHNVCEMNIGAYLDKKYGIFDYLSKQKDTGRIKHLGFSAHGGLETVKRFLEAYGHKMEFCQIQLNYLDWSFQGAKEKVELLNERHIPIWVMEPLRGGRLASLSSDACAKLKALRPDEDITAWAFRFLQSIQGVRLVISGMSNLEQLRSNINTFNAEKPLDKTEFETLLGVAGDMLKETALPCTACRYCVEHCPRQLDIPTLITLYNEHCFTLNAGLFAFIAPMQLMAMPKDKQPGACDGCKSCEAGCPQKINISQALADFTARLKA